MTRVEDPVSVDYRGYTIYKCGPWTQGPYLCQTLRLLEGFDLKAMEHLSPDYIHVVVESLKLALADRDEYYGDPRFVDVPLQELLSDDYTQLRRPLIDMRHASRDRRPGDPYGPRPLAAQATAEDSTAKIPVQDTTTCVVADRWGNVVAATPSCNLVGNKPGPSGITQGNRVRSLNTTPGHPNRVQPGKRPRITLTPDHRHERRQAGHRDQRGGRRPSGPNDAQRAAESHRVRHVARKAVTAPRFNTFHHQNSFDPNPDRAAAFVGAGKVQVNEDIPEPVRQN